MPLPRVMVDFDSTINDFDGFLLQTLNERFGSNYVLGDIKTWDFIREMDPEHVQHTWGENVYQSREWTLAIPPLPGSIEALNMLRDMWYVRVVTARGGEMLGWVQQWLKNNGLGWLKVSCTNRKADWVRRYGYDVAIEDAPHHVLDLWNEGIEQVYMIDKPYNSHIKEDCGLTRVKSLREAVEDMLLYDRTKAPLTANIPPAAIDAKFRTSHTAATS